MTLQNKVIIYTDGGCSPNPGAGGWAAVLISPTYDNKKKEIYGYEERTTNNRMEMTAAIMALKTLKRPCSVDLHTDSQYLKKAFTDGWIARWLRNGWKTAAKTPVLNEDLWRELIELTNTHTVHWKWVKGHANNKYNNRCDELVAHARKKKENKPAETTTGQ